MLYFQVSPAAGKTVGTSIRGQHFRFTPNTPCHRIKGEREKEYKENPPKVLNKKCKVVSQYCSVPPYPSTYSMPAPPEHLLRASTPPGRHCSCGLGAPENPWPWERSLFPHLLREQGKQSSIVSQQPSEAISLNSQP